MKLDIWIVHTYIWSYGLYTRLYGPNTLTHQSDYVRQPQVTSVITPPSHRILSGHVPTVYTYVYVSIISIYDNVTIAASTVADSWPYTETHNLSDASTVIGIGIFTLLRSPDFSHIYWFDSDLPIMIILSE